MPWNSELQTVNKIYKISYAIKEDSRSSDGGVEGRQVQIQVGWWAPAWSMWDFLDSVFKCDIQLVMSI